MEVPSRREERRRTSPLLPSRMDCVIGHEKGGPKGRLLKGRVLQFRHCRLAAGLMVRLARVANMGLGA